MLLDKSRCASGPTSSRREQPARRRDERVEAVVGILCSYVQSFLPRFFFLPSTAFFISVVCCVENCDCKEMRDICNKKIFTKLVQRRVRNAQPGSGKQQPCSKRQIVTWNSVIRNDWWRLLFIYHKVFPGNWVLPIMLMNPASCCGQSNVYNCTPRTSTVAKHIPTIIWAYMSVGCESTW